MCNLHRILSIVFFIVFFILPISANTVLEVTEDDFVVGDKNAPVTIIEYASLSCSHCADFHNNTLDDLIKEYVDTGKARIVFRDFPFNYPALLGSMVLRCIPEDVRYDYMNALFQLQQKWVVRENAKSTQELYKIMQSGGMTKEEFETCTNNVELENTILQALIAAQNEFNIQSTPSFLINGNLVEGNKSIKEFRQIIDKILSE
jgi:protein-disulfide isomerase|tara:strand:- start:330 stop:941 length:612 start_codon:yes stop_codon:yes gene_type:complete